MEFGSLSGKKIVVVEDDVLIGEGLAASFEERNQVRLFTSGEGLRDALPQLGDIDVFILDYKLPGMNGVEAFHMLRPRYGQAKFVCITGEVSVELAQDIQALGFDALILKPFDFRILEKNILDLVSAG
jgi:two-component system nitrogen regulation response regulator GlnG